MIAFFFENIRAKKATSGFSSWLRFSRRYFHENWSVGKKTSRSSAWCGLYKIPRRRIAKNTQIATRLETVQAWLLDVGSSLCTPRTTTFNPRKLRRTKGVRHADVVALEGWIDEADAHLARLSSFILPGGSPGASALHVARTVCRRAERRAWPLLMDGHGDEVLGIFLNRLSDFLFVAARLDAAGAGGTEQEYKIEFRVDKWQRRVVTA